MRIADMKSEVVDGILVVAVHGEVDMSNSAVLAAEIRRQTTNEALGVVLDLTEVEYLDSSGVQLLFELRERLGTRGQEMRLVVPAGAAISHTLDIVDARRAFGVLGTRAEALRALATAVPRIETGDASGDH